MWGVGMMADQGAREPTMTQPELAERLGVSTVDLRQLTKAGVVSPTRFGTFPVYSEEDFERARTFLDSSRRGRRSDLYRPSGDKPAEAYCTPIEAAAVLGVNPRTVARWVELGKLQAWAQGLLRSDVEGMAAQMRPESRTA
jgi:predicted site-specific integrase-resolvase